MFHHQWPRDAQLRERMWFVLNEAGHPQPEVEASSDVRFAIVGKRNAGKSSLLNALCGEERAIVSDIAGTTRDAVDVRIEYEGRGLIAVDTAGLRKRKSFADDIEHYAYFRMLDAIRRADVAILVIDATEPVSSVDRKLAAELVRLAKPTLLVVNKTDLVDPAEAGAEKFAEYLAKELKAFNFAPIVFAAAAKSEGVGELSQLVLDLYDQARERMATGPLNAAFEAILKERGPSSALGTRAKIYFVSQTSVAPPTIVCKVNKPELFEGDTAATSKTDCVSWCHSRRCHLWSTLSPDLAKVCTNSEPLVAVPNTMPPKNWTSSCPKSSTWGTRCHPLRIRIKKRTKIRSKGMIREDHAAAPI